MISTVEDWLGKDNTLGIKIWRTKYQQNNESFDHWLDRVSGGDEAVRKLILDKKFLFAGRILSNRGVENSGTLSNCYLVGVDDSINSIYKTAGDMALTFKAGGGVGVDIGNLAPAGAKVNNPAKTSSGAVSFIDLFTTTTGLIGQCIEEHQRVLTPNGLKEIKDVVVGDEIWTEKGFVKVCAVKKQGVQKVYDVRTKYGYSIKTTDNHTFATSDGDGLKDMMLCDIDKDPICILAGRNAITDYIPLTHNFDKGTRDIVNQCGYCKTIPNNQYMDISAPTILDEKLAYVVGYCHGDGYTDGDKALTVACCSRDNDIIERICEYTKSIFGHTPYVLYKKGENCVKIGIGGKEIVHFLNENGLNKPHTDALIVPDLIKCSPASVQIAYISGLIDADGYVSKKTGYSITTINKSFAKGIQDLLLMNGIFSKIHIEEVNIPNWHDKYVVSVVGAVSKKKLIDNCISIKVLSKEVGFARDCFKTPYSAKELGVSHNLYEFVPTSGTLSLNAYDRLMECGAVSGNHIITDTIISRECCGGAMTYDITLEEENRFWCEGVYVHNSGRRGALMVSIPCDHPDVEEFIKLKTDVNRATTANLSIRVTDDFMKAVMNDEDWICAFTRRETGECISKTFKAKELYKIFCDANYDYGEPGLLFWNEVESYNMLNTYPNFKFGGVNPCAEEALPVGGACLLGSMNLAEYADWDGTFNFDQFEADVAVAIKALDKVQDEGINLHPLEIQRKMAKDWKQIGLGIMGLGDALIKMNIRYGSKDALELCDIIGDTLAKSAMRTSVELGNKYGSFPKFNAKNTASSSFWRVHYPEVTPIAMRNSQLLAIAPTGTISTMIGVTGGIEPLFALEYERITKSLEGKDVKYKVIPTVVANARDRSKLIGLVCASDIDYRARIDMQSIWQKHIDSSISSTINLPENFPKDEVGKLYMYAWDKKLKGVTVFRDGCKRAGILTTEKTKETSDDELMGIRRKIQTGCGVIWLNVFVDKDNRVHNCFVCKSGSSGGCERSLTTIGRLISLAYRNGATNEEVTDQLLSSGTCPAYAVRQATKGDVSPGHSCSGAIAHVLKEIVGGSGHSNDEDKGDTCPECGSKLNATNGCFSCSNPQCTWSRCG